MALLTPQIVVAAETHPLLANVDVTERAMYGRLDVDAYWNDVSNTKELSEHLKVIRRLRLKSLAPVLARHLAYSPFGPDDVQERIRPVEVEYPVCPAVVAIGSPVVPSLIERLSIVDPEDRVGTGGVQHTLAVMCLIQIYSPGGFGKQLAKQQIELAAEKAAGPFKERLMRAAKHPMLDPKVALPASE